MVENTPEIQAGAALQQRVCEELIDLSSAWIEMEIYLLPVLFHSMRMPVRKLKGRLG